MNVKLPPVGREQAYPVWLQKTKLRHGSSLTKEWMHSYQVART